MNDHERAVTSLRRRLGIVLCCKYAVGFTTLWAFVWGIAVLVLRTEFGTPQTTLLWGVAAMPAVLGLGAWLALRRLPPPTILRALLDHRSRLGGLLMAGAEVEAGNWNSKIPKPNETPVRWDGRRSWGLLAVAAAFLAAAFWVPERFAGAFTSNPLEIGDKVNKLAKQIQVLKEEAILEQDRAETLKEKLEQIRDEATGKEPGKTLEALDHLREVTKNSAKESAESAVRKTEELAKAETLAEAMRQAGPELDAKLMAEGMKELASLMEKLAKENAAFDKLGETMKSADGKLTPEQLKQLAEALKDAKGELAEKLARLHEAGLIDLETLKQCEKAGTCQAEALAELLKQCDGSESVCDMLGY